MGFSRKYLAKYYDASHGIIAAVLINLIAGYGLWNYNGNHFISILFLGGAIAIVWALQGVNESWQLNNGDVVKEYGSYKGFIKNSKKDWRYFIIGNYIGVMIYGLQVVLFGLIK